jgi:hypothetical protein
MNKEMGIIFLLFLLRMDINVFKEIPDKSLRVIRKLLLEKVITVFFNNTHVFEVMCHLLLLPAERK